MSTPPIKLRVLMLAPTRRDSDVARDLLARIDVSVESCPNAAHLASKIDATVGAILLTDSSLGDRDMDKAVGALAAQPPWSDIPVILMCRAVSKAPAPDAVVRSLTNVTLLERPTSARTLVSAVQTAIRARLRQYQIRDQLAALRDADDALRRADQRKDEFLAMLAHELRNPLAPIRNASAILARLLPQEPRLQSTTGIIERQIAHLTRLVDDLLDVSRITQGRIALKRATLELASVVTQALESVEPLIRERRHTVTSELCPERLCINGDGARLVQCVGNLLTNAAKYTDPGGRIVVVLRRDHSQAVLSVTDNGAGIPKDMLPQIFELFVQSKRTLDRAQGGLGIGLSVVRRLVEMHGGQVSARSDGLGRGSTFSICLPLVQEVQPSAESARPPYVAPKRILIVDDNVDAADSIAMLLRLDGHHTETVYSSTDALERASQLHPDVVLLDIGLPTMDGYEVARRLRGQGSTANIVALTGYGRTEDLERAKTAGFDAHLVKPVDSLSLATVLSH